MKPTQALHEAGQSLWLDNTTRALLDGGILARYVAEYSVTGLTSNPTIFDKAIRDGTAYDAGIAARKAAGASDEQVFFNRALADLRRAAELFAPVHARTDGVDGWVSLEASPPLVSPHWARLANEGARAQRLLRASTSVKDPRAPDVLYVEALAAPFTVNTMPEAALEAFADHGTVGELLPGDGTASLAAELQRHGAEAFAASWQDLLARIGARHEQLARTV
jgi:transaldolase